VDVGRPASDHSVARHVLSPLKGAVMIGTPSSSAPLDESTRLRANPAASWGAILAGAVAAVSLSVVLVTLGAGLGFASVSPWSDHGLSASSFTVASTIWLIITQWLSAAAGGYLAGRLRHRWLATHTHEVFFRDTAHGLVTWGVATLFVVAVISSSVIGVLSGAAHTIGGVAAAGGQGVAAMGHSDMAGGRGPMPSDPAGGPGGAYDLDKLFRSTVPNPTPDVSGARPHGDDSRGEVLHIAANATTNGSVSDEDRQYLSTLVANKTGISQDEAQRRVDAYVKSLKEATDKAKEAADAARKVAAKASLYTALALLIGAFIASVSAALGGRLRDEHT
jgi:hypothetical protein